jgi:Zn-dependent protease with chaperone function
MASAIRLSPKQLPELYKHLPPICERLGIEEPEFYLQMNPMPNAFTFGDTKIFITVTSGLVEMLDDEELDAVIAHECGHILCRHVLYNSLANYLKLGADALGILGNLTAPVEYALYYWNRKSELSCDRCAAIVTSPQVVARVMARLAGGPRSLTERISSIEWAKQADEYDQIRNSNLWNKALQISAVLSMSHPFAAVRVREILRWEHSPQYAQLKQSPLLNAGAKTCNACGKVVNDDWAFCKHCGNKLK